MRKSSKDEPYIIKSIFLVLVKDIPSFRAEDSSDYMSSDVEMSSSGVDLATAASSANNLHSISSSHKVGLALINCTFNKF